MNKVVIFSLLLLATSHSYAMWRESDPQREEKRKYFSELCEKYNYHEKLYVEFFRRYPDQKLEYSEHFL